MRDVADLRVGDVVLSWVPDDPCGDMLVAAIDRVPVGHMDGAVTWRVNITYAHGVTVHGATGTRKVKLAQS
jgi:hypothetical protein